MRVLHVVPTYIPAWRYGGPIRSVHGLCCGLVGQGIEVDVVTTSVDGPGDSDVPHDRPVTIDGVSVRYFRSRRLRRIYHSPPLARHLDLVVAGYDVVHVHAVFLWPPWRAARIARRNEVPFVLSPRGMLVRDLIEMKSRWVKSAWIHAVETRTLADAAALIASTPHERDEIERLGLETPNVVIHPNGIELPADRGEKSEDDGKILYLGRISPEKGLDRLIDAIAELPDAELEIAGNDETGYRRQLEPRIESRGLNGRVKFVVSLGEDEKWDRLRRAAVVVLPSYSENFGMVTLEAMAMRTPVVLTPEVGVSDSIRRHGGGVVADDGIAEAIAPLLADVARRRTLGDRARDVVEEHFSWDRIARNMIETYRRVG